MSTKLNLISKALLTYKEVFPPQLDLFLNFEWDNSSF